MEVLVGPFAAFLERDTERFELGRQPARANAHDQPPTAQVVDRTQEFRGEDRVAVGDDEDARTDGDVGGFGGQVGQDRQGFGHELRDIGRAFGHDDVVADPDGVEADVFDGAGHRPDGFRRRELVGLWDGDSVAHLAPPGLRCPPILQESSPDDRIGGPALQWGSSREWRGRIVV